MKLRLKSVNRHLLVTLVFLVLFPFCAQLIIEGKSLLVIGLPLVALLFVAAFAFKNGFYYFFLVSPFIGLIFWERENLLLYLTDLLFPLFCCFWLLSSFGKDKVTKFKKFSKVERHLLYSLLMLFIGSVLSLLINAVGKSGIDILTSIVFLIRILQLIAIIYFLLGSRDSLVVRRNSIVVICIAMATQLPIIIFQYIFFYVGVEGNDIHQLGTMPSHHSVIAMVAVTVIPLFLYFYNSKMQVLKKMILLMLIGVLLYLVFLSETRSLMLGIALAFVFYSIFSVRLSKQTLYYASALVVFAIIFWYLPVTQKLIAETFTTTESSGIDSSSYSRLFIWKGAWESIVKASFLQKLFGQGIAFYPTIEYDFVIWGGGRSATGAHNNFLHVLAETGIWGLMAWAYHFGVILYFSFRKGAKKLVRSSFGLVTLALLFSGIGQETFWFQSAFGSFWFLYAIVLALIIIICTPQKRSLSLNDSLK